MKNWAKIFQKMKHLPTGKIGTYVEHTNYGEGYMMQPDDKGRIIVGEYNDFVPVEESA